MKECPDIAQAAAKVGAIIAHPKMAIAALHSGASVLVYPGGAEDVFRPHSLRHQIYFAERHSFIKLALREKVPIVPLISTGAHDTLIVLADCYKIIQQLHEWGIPWLFDIDPVVFPIYLGLPWGLAFGPLPNIPYQYLSAHEFVHQLCLNTTVEKQRAIAITFTLATNSSAVECSKNWMIW